MKKQFTGSGIALCLTLTAAAQTAGPQPEPPTNPNSKLMLIELRDLKAVIGTDAGSSSSQLGGQIALEFVFDQSGKPASVSLATANMIGSSVATSRGASGLWSASLRSPSAKSVPQNGVISFSADLSLHYRLIDQVVGERPMGDDYSAPYTEVVKAQLMLKFDQTPARDSTSVMADGFIGLRLSEAILGSIRTVDISLERRARELMPLLCPTRVLALQPVFVRSDPSDPTPTGTAWPTFLDRAPAIWRKACVAFEVREPRYVDNAAFKIRTAANYSALTDSVDVADAIEIFFISAWNPRETFGGGGTIGSGTANAKIVTADDNLLVSPPSVNHLAHELGHVLDLCHPEGYDTRPCPVTMVYGSDGTVMKPSGFWTDNPELQSRSNCRQSSNPLLYFRRLTCCYTPDCDTDCTSGGK